MTSSSHMALAALFMLMEGCAAQPAPHTSTKISAAIRDAESIAASAVEDRRLPGLTVVVLQEDDSLLARGYGRADVERAEPVNATTVFQLGSISKQFLAALVIALAEDGMLSLDEPVARYLPDFPQLPRSVRVRHLLNHTSGVRELFSLPEAQAGFDDLTRSRDELVPVLRRVPVDFLPGSRWSYSNTNYALLALVVERVAAKPYELVLAERFFGPLGLASLRQCTPLPQGPDEARGHEWQNGANTTASPENMNWIRGDGGICGHALDLARWTRLLATGRVVPPRLYEQMIAPTHLADGREADYGFGLSLVQPDEQRKVAHNGAMRGFSASAAYYPDVALTVIVLTNRGDVRTESIERRIARRLLGLSQPIPREHTLSTVERQRFTGTYDIGVFDVRVVDRDGRLWLETPRPGPTTPLRYVGGNMFAAEVDPDAYWLTFSAGDGPAQRLRLLMGAMHWYGLRRP